MSTNNHVMNALKSANFIDGVRWDNEHFQINYSEPNYYCGLVAVINNKEVKP